MFPLTLTDVTVNDNYIIYTCAWQHVLCGAPHHPRHVHVYVYVYTHIDYCNRGIDYMCLDSDLVWYGGECKARAWLSVAAAVAVTLHAILINDSVVE
jgi:hypothetical protein